MLKVGNEVKFVEHSGKYRIGDKGTITQVNKGNSVPYEIDNDWWVCASRVVLISKRGRLTKSKKIKYIAQYEIDGDPVKEFYSRPELMKWLKDNEDSEVEWKTIRIYPVDKVMKPHKNIKISLRNL